MFFRSCCHVVILIHFQSKDKTSGRSWRFGRVNISGALHRSSIFGKKKLLLSLKRPIAVPNSGSKKCKLKFWFFCELPSEYLFSAVSMHQFGLFVAFPQSLEHDAELLNYLNFMCARLCTNPKCTSKYPSCVWHNHPILPDVFRSIPWSNHREETLSSTGSPSWSWKVSQKHGRQKVPWDCWFWVVFKISVSSASIWWTYNALWSLTLKKSVTFPDTSRPLVEYRDLARPPWSNVGRKATSKKGKSRDFCG